MSTFEKILIPLIDNNIKHSDIDSDFIGIYTEDINVPGLDYIYIVYNYNMNNLHPNLGINGIDTIKNIGGKLYQIYKFPRTLDIKKILSGNFSTLSNKGIFKIFYFWNNIDDDIANYPFNRVIAKEPYSKIIPEEEYVEVLKRRKPQGVTVRR